MTSLLKKLGYTVTCIIIGICIGLLIQLPSCNKSTTEYVSVPVHDTITITQTAIKEKTVVKYTSVLDTFYIQNRDTIFIELPIEHKSYNDTIKSDSTSTEIRIDYSGFNAEIDSVYLKHNYFYQQETIIKKPRKFGLDVVVGPYVGYGVNFNQGIHSGVEVGVGVSLGFGWRIK